MIHTVHQNLIKSLALWIIFISILLPVITPLFLVLFIYRRTVICAARLFRKSELIEPIGGLDISFCVDDFWTKPKGAISFIWILKGPIDPKLIHDRFHQAIDINLSKSSTQTSSPYNYDRLTSLYPSFWLNIPFWTKTKEPFEMKKHMNVIRFPIEDSSNPNKINTTNNRFQSRNHLNSFLSLWMQQKFKKALPLWEVLVIPEFFLNDSSSDPNNKLSLLALKSHHVIGDGYSKLKLLEKVVDGYESHNLPEKKTYTSHVPLAPPSPNISCYRKDMRRNDDHTEKSTHINSSSVGKHWWTNFDNDFLPLLFLTPIALWKLGKDFVFHRDCFTHYKSTSNVLMSNTILDMEKLKQLRKKFKKERDQDIPLIVIGVSIFAGAVRRLFLCELKDMNHDEIKEKHKKPPGGSGGTGNAWNGNSVITNSRICPHTWTCNAEGHECTVPKHTNFVMALPLGNKTHPGDFRFCNHWTHGIFNVEVEEPDCVKRILKLNENFQQNLSLRWPEVYHSCILPWQSLFPRYIWKKITDFKMGAPIGSTNLSGPSHSIHVGGQEVLEKYAYVGLLWRHSSMTCAFFSYNGMLSATLVANQDIIKSQLNAEQLIHKYMHSELEELLDNS